MLLLLLRYRDDVFIDRQPNGFYNEKCSCINIFSIYSMNDWHDTACAYNKIRSYMCEIDISYTKGETINFYFHKILSWLWWFEQQKKNKQKGHKVFFWSFYKMHCLVSNTKYPKKSVSLSIYLSKTSGDRHRSFCGTFSESWKCYTNSK